jgi:transmembrane sensor
LIVEEWSVAQVLDELGRYHRGVILLRDQELGARLVSGFYDLTRPVEAVRAVAQAHGGRLREIGPWLLVVSRG